ncbi:MAG: hypothetical protein EBR30_12170 [Cytophagia bacterium]|nr:hypothetical protein [Cytophagia bacterium]
MRKIIVFIFLLIIYKSSMAQPKSDLTFVFLNKRTDLPEMPKPELDKIMEGHMANISSMAKDGRLLAAGPFEGGGGIFVLKTSSIEEAKQWLASDPGVKAERWRLEFLPVIFRTGKPCTALEPYEMVSYHFIRYGLTLAKHNVQQASATMRNHEQFMKDLYKTGNVIAEATFGDSEGSILIMKGELDQRVVESSPAVKELLFEIDVKKLWIAKGSFCE